MGTIYKRGEKLSLGFKDLSGKWQYKSSGFSVGQEKQAQKLLKQIELQVEAEKRFATSTDNATPTGPVTLKMFAERWLKDRERRHIRDVVNDRGRLTKHVYPILGNHAIAELRPRHIRDLVRTWRANEEMAPRTLRKVYGTMHTLFRDAVIEELIDNTPCVLSSKELGPSEDKDPEWRATAVYDRDELVKLISSELLPPDRRMVYALMGLAGLRHGEMAGLHWRNYDPTREPLGKLVIARSYDHATTKTKRPREVPVHPTLAQVLAEWREKGCTEILGHTPEPDDLLIPSREGRMRSRHHTLNKLLEDLERLGMRSRRGHDLRRTFITLARADGARADLLEMVSHAPRGNIINIYTSMPWANLCAEVAKLNITLPKPAEVIPLRCAANDGSSALNDEPMPHASYTLTTRPTTAPTLVAKPSNSFSNSASKLVEAPGVESAGAHPLPENIELSSLSSRALSVISPVVRRNDGEKLHLVKPAKNSVLDVLRAAQRAVLAGDVHRARVLAREVAERPELAGTEPARLADVPQDVDQTEWLGNRRLA